MTGERFIDVGRDVQLCYEAFGDRAHPPLVLVMGLGMQMIGWDDDWCEDLAARGFHVVRFDNRDAGRSTRMRGRPPTLLALATCRFGPEQYTLADMAADTAGLARELDLGPVHLVGASLGSMIAQTVAARHPASVRSLTSIMSTTGNRFKGQPRPGIYRHVLATAPNEREAYAEQALKFFHQIGSPGFPTDHEEIRERARRSHDRGPNPAGTGRQIGAMLKSGNRTRELHTIAAPTLVIHGTADRLVVPSGGRATADAIAGSQLIEIEGMGHDLPRAVWPRLLAAIAEHARAADRESTSHTSRGATIRATASRAYERGT